MLRKRYNKLISMLGFVKVSKKKKKPYCFVT